VDDRIGLLPEDFQLAELDRHDSNIMTDKSRCGLSASAKQRGVQ
jgi:hypothetical protein